MPHCVEMKHDGSKSLTEIHRVTHLNYLIIENLWNGYCLDIYVGHKHLHTLCPFQKLIHLLLPPELLAQIFQFVKDSYPAYRLSHHLPRMNVEPYHPNPTWTGTNHAVLLGMLDWFWYTFLARWWWTNSKGFHVAFLIMVDFTIRVRKSMWEFCQLLNISIPITFSMTGEITTE